MPECLGDLPCLHLLELLTPPPTQLPCKQLIRFVRLQCAGNVEVAVHHGKVAKVAVAREILTLCYYGLREGEIRRLEAAGARANSSLAMASTGRPTG
jgi:hypothetical protein